MVSLRNGGILSGLCGDQKTVAERPMDRSVGGKQNVRGLVLRLSCRGSQVLSQQRLKQGPCSHRLSTEQLMALQENSFECFSIPCAPAANEGSCHTCPYKLYM